ncbi:hemerythrin domain-containing protein [Mycobacterium deserti]|uniref:Hemerythrin domain-containing protein n=1 Tax=Mycobacterium deserti TaxID=2978347 RepID=A0ABT2MFN7_9MYCO|nr:hemerythrin domain-containing protein [Mycobacterium deserti]MCT7661100.1 hemerythrin domain-containing protein [Mycobacterium deserti]
MTTDSAAPETMPSEVPDVSGMKIAHRVMLRDLDRTTGVAMAIADGEVPATRRRTRALVGYLTLMVESIHHHHRAEDHILWPVIERRAGTHIDLAPLTEDHAALEPKLGGLAAAVRQYAADPSRRTAAVIAARLVDIRAMLTEHIAEEERDTFPVIERYLSVGDWQDVEAQIRKTARLTFELPRIAAAVTPTELARLKEQAGPVIEILLLLVKPRYRRMEKAIWG